MENRKSSQTLVYSGFKDFELYKKVRNVSVPLANRLLTSFSILAVIMGKFRCFKKHYETLRTFEKQSLTSKCAWHKALKAIYIVATVKDPSYEHSSKWCNMDSWRIIYKRNNLDFQSPWRRQQYIPSGLFFFPKGSIFAQINEINTEN